MSNPKDYTVGWICAIRTEYVAAQAFLDERHEGPEYVSTNDNNHYTLGKLGKHNVVIAVLPYGEYGISGATGVAKDMLHSFPNVRIGLMVGIGGGAPSPNHDIRLGDIVVSASSNGKGSVFQYDFGKTIQEQDFQPTGFLNQPSTVLRTAVHGLMAQYESEGHRIEETINSILEKKPRLRQKYKRPDKSSDRLYKSKVIHPPNSNASCTAVCGNNPSNLVLRLERTEVEDNPAIHFGLVASANQLMKDALVRDLFAAEKGVLCFEMEAAGLMNQFPFLIIRGICDYSDSHKNEEWQGYAAMAAAAYAKDLLYQIPPNKIEAERRISDILSSILNNISETRANVETMGSNLDKNRDLEILDWLTPTDYGTEQSENIQKRQPGTGQWLLDSAEYQAWLKSGRQTLFCPGIPGAGKTVLTSIVVQELNAMFTNDSSTGIAYLYCNFSRRDEQKVEHLLLGLLKQLTQERSPLPASIKTLYNHHKDKRTGPSFDEISRALHSVAAIYSRVFIIVDAVDESEASEGCQMRLLSEIFSLQAKCGANFFATSRPMTKIIEKFEGSTCLEIRARENDIRAYLDGHISILPRFVLRSPGLQEEIKNKIVKAVDGMFLLAQLYLKLLDDKTSVKDIKSTLKSFQNQTESSSEDQRLEVLTEAYRKTILRIKDQKAGFRQLAENVLLWITCAKRPLIASELQHALAVEVGERKLDTENLREIEDIVSVCAGLVTIDKGSNIIRLIHYTAQEYFERTHDYWFPNAETNITTICITYLSFTVFERGFCQTVDEFEEQLRLNQLYEYAVRNWGHHARKASILKQALSQAVIDFLESKAKVEASSQVLLTTKRYPSHLNYRLEFPRKMTGLHLTAYFGVKEAMNILLKKKIEADSKDIYGRTPLSRASSSGHEAVVELLLESNAELESRDNCGRTPLSRAAENGHKSIINLLLERGAEPESKDNKGRTPLARAAYNGHKPVVALLFKIGADRESKDYTHIQALSRAVPSWHEVESGDYSESITISYGQTPLSWAACDGREAAVKLLLEIGAELESRDSNGQTPLSWAAAGGHEAVIELLLKRGAQLESKDNNGRTPLSWGAQYGHKAIVNLLLIRDAEPDSKDNEGQTPLSWAAREEYNEPIVKLLLEGVAYPDSKDIYNRTPLWWAAKNGYEATIKLLLGNGADPESKDIFGSTPLLEAAENEHEAVVKLLQS